MSDPSKNPNQFPLGGYRFRLLRPQAIRPTPPLPSFRATFNPLEGWYGFQQRHYNPRIADVAPHRAPAPATNGAPNLNLDLNPQIEVFSPAVSDNSIDFEENVLTTAFGTINVNSTSEQLRPQMTPPTVQSQSMTPIQHPVSIGFTRSSTGRTFVPQVPIFENHIYEENLTSTVRSKTILTKQPNWTKLPLKISLMDKKRKSKKSKPLPSTKSQVSHTMHPLSPLSRFYGIMANEVPPPSNSTTLSRDFGFDIRLSTGQPFPTGTGSPLQSDIEVTVHSPDDHGIIPVELTPHYSNINNFDLNALRQEEEPLTDPRTETIEPIQHRPPGFSPPTVISTKVTAKRSHKGQFSATKTKIKKDHIQVFRGLVYDDIYNYEVDVEPKPTIVSMNLNIEGPVYLPTFDFPGKELLQFKKTRWFKRVFCMDFSRSEEHPTLEQRDQRTLVLEAIRNFKLAYDQRRRINNIISFTEKFDDEPENPIFVLHILAHFYEQNPKTGLDDLDYFIVQWEPILDRGFNRNDGEISFVKACDISDRSYKRKPIRATNPLEEISMSLVKNYIAGRPNREFNTADEWGAKVAKDTKIIDHEHDELRQIFQFDLNQTQTTSISEFNNLIKEFFASRILQSNLQFEKDNGTGKHQFFGSFINRFRLLQSSHLKLYSRIFGFTASNSKRHKKQKYNIRANRSLDETKDYMDVVTDLHKLFKNEIKCTVCVLTILSSSKSSKQCIEMKNKMHCYVLILNREFSHKVKSKNSYTKRVYIFDPALKMSTNSVPTRIGLLLNHFDWQTANIFRFFGEQHTDDSCYLRCLHFMAACNGDSQFLTRLDWIPQVELKSKPEPNLESDSD